jgi:ATP-dependent helicase/nuclease subunit A
MGNYLDISKSVVISSPAGSGKTEKLARRYISLLLNGFEIEKILCITFTEKAAAEMKDRILNIAEKEHPELFQKIKEKMPLMRIHTIHAFCLKLLKRFSIELGLDPSIDVTDEFNSSILWSEAVYECLIEEKEKPSLFTEMIKQRGIKGWDRTYAIIDSLYQKRPLSDLLVKTGAQVESEEEKKILALYSKCIKRYTNKKRDLHVFDFNDLELLTYETLNEHPEWQNILYAFDEHTDHILVDEFQDTSSLQWKIIDKLTEEWRSGLGAKRSSGKTPTIFLVGDNKQSIYLFRGANAGVFEDVKDKLSEWLKQDFYFEEVKENFRSLPAIIDFTNKLFEKLMPPSLYESWRTKYAPFTATRSGQGNVELILVDADENTKKSRIKEASSLARRIRSLVGRYEIYDGEKQRLCSYADMAVLLRKRTHLSVFENALRKEKIPFIAVKGIGFYNEPEVAILRELLLFIIDPSDDYSLFCILRSPLFDLDYGTILQLADKTSSPEQTLFDKIQYDMNFLDISKKLSNWIKNSKDMTLAMLLEQALNETEGWKYFWEKQRLANIKKFIKIIESYESSGFSTLGIREKLIKARDKEESKANVNTEGMDAVKIMTIHAAKGLQFPMVFIPSLDERNTSRTGPLVINEEREKLFLSLQEDSSKRKETEHFKAQKDKELEEEKRLFYVAVTRSRDFLCMLGAFDKNKKPEGRLSYITDNLDIFNEKGGLKNTDLIKIITEPEIEELYSKSLSAELFSHSSKTTDQGPFYIEPLKTENEIIWRDVTEETDIRLKHGEDWIILGKIFHKLFEEFSKSILTHEKINDRVYTLAKNETPSEKKAEKFAETIINDLKKIIASPFKDILLPRENSFAELPFIFQKNNTVFRGRIDRVIIENNIAMIYDYKTYPVKDEEIEELMDKYKFQIEIYKQAVEEIFSIKTKGYLLFTHRPLLIDM